MYLRLLVLMPMFLLLSACRESPEGASDKPVAATVQAKTPSSSSSPPPTTANTAPTLESLVRADDTLPSVRARLGEAAVMAVELPGPEGESASGWRLYPYEEARTVEVWLNETGRPQAIFVRGSKSDWVRADGVRLGLDTNKLQAINGRPFKFFGFEWDYAGAVSDWRGGTLAPEGRTRGPVVLCPPDPHPSDYPTGDSEFPSDDPRVVARPAVVCEFGVNLDVVPSSADARP